MPVKDVSDECDIIEINARMYDVKEFYLDTVIDNIEVNFIDPCDDAQYITLDVKD